MRGSFLLLASFLVTGDLAAQDTTSPPHLVAAELDPAPWNVTSGGIAAFDARVDEKGSVTAADVVQDVAPYSAMLGASLGSWRFEPAREGGRAVPSRVLVLGFFRPPAIHFAAPENPRYKGANPPPELPWPTSVVQDVAPYSAMLGASLGSWRFEPAREGGRAVPSRVLVLGFFRPPAIHFAAPENPRYKGANAPPELPWPTSVVVPPYPPNVLGSGRVVIEADVSSRGLVTAVRILSPPGAFDSAATQSLQQWKFRAAKRGNHEVGSRAFIVLSFLGTTS